MGDINYTLLISGSQYVALNWKSSFLASSLLLFNLYSFRKKGFPAGSAGGKESTCNVGDLGPIPGLGRSPGEGKGYPLQYSGLENCMDCVVHDVAKSRTHRTFTLERIV